MAFAKQYRGGNDSADLEKRVLAGKEEFPYVRRFESPETIRGRFNNLKNHKLEFTYHPFTIARLTNVNRRNGNEWILLFDGNFRSIAVRDHEHASTNYISTYFTEAARMQCKRSDQKQTPLEYWQSNPTQIIKHCKQKYKSITLHNLRETAYDLHYECTTFKSSLVVDMITFLRQFGPISSMLDISAGWGDRMIGAIASGVDYTGVDPNSALQAGYKEIADFFGATNSARVIHAPFEDAVIPNTNYDLVLSSPPFWSLEEYSAEPTQSHLRHGTPSKWYNDFLLVAIKKALYHLRVYGHLVLYINDVKGEQPFVENMIRDVCLLANTVYLGCIAQFNADKNSAAAIQQRRPLVVQPFFIFRKIPSIRPISAGETYHQHFTLAAEMIITAIRIFTPKDIISSGADHLAVSIAIAAKICQIRAYYALPYRRPLHPTSIAAASLGLYLLEDKSATDTTYTHLDTIVTPTFAAEFLHTKFNGRRVKYQGTTAMCDYLRKFRPDDAAGEPVQVD